MDNPWTTLSEEQHYDNPWITVTEYQVLSPKGAPGIYGKVHFKNRALAVIPIDAQGNTWLVGQYRYTLSEYSWEIPMGGGPLEEPILAAAQRELREECGLSAGHWQELMKIHTSNSVTDEVGYAFLARELTEGATAWDDTEQLQIRKLPFAEVMQMVRRGEITDCLSIAALYRAAEVLAAERATP